MKEENNILSFIYNDLKSWLNSENGENLSDFYKVCEKATQACEFLIDSENPQNKGLPTWETINNEQKKARTLLDRFSESIYYLYVYSSEVVITRNEAIKARYALEILDDLINEIKEDEGFSKNVKKSIDLYEREIKYKLIQERCDKKFKENLEIEVKYAIEGHEDHIDLIRKDIYTNREILESIENETGLTSLFSGMKEFSKQLKQNLRKIRGDLKRIMYLMFVVPVLTGLSYLTFDADYGFLLSSISVMFVLGYFFRINLRKEDQYEQMLAKLENRMAISIFHKYQLGDMDEAETLAANDKFHNLMYKDLETSEWNAPDVSDNLINIIKAIKK